MYVSHILLNVQNLGPGNRLGIWFAGCNKHCQGCIADDLKQTHGFIDISPEDLASIVNYKVAESGASGITVSGGDPLEQEGVIQFLSLLDAPDILVYTGFTLEEMKSSGLYEMIYKYISVLKCGRYVPSLDNGHPLMGSSNQELIYCKPEYRKLYTDYISNHQRKLHFYELAGRLFFSGLPVSSVKGA